MSIEVPKDADPLDTFRRWFEEARGSEPRDPEAMTVATCGPGGAPSARTLLLKGFGEEGFIFYTNLESHKASDLAANPRAALLFFWKSLGRQVRIGGPVAPLARERVEQYFHSRPRGSQVGAWASLQSSPIEDYKILEEKVAHYEAEFSGMEVPLPEHWGGFVLTPLAIEFWAEGDSRLHRRTRFSREDPGSPWCAEHLCP